MRPSGRSRAGLYGGGLRLWYGRGESAAATAAGGMQGFPAALSSFIGRAGAVRDVVTLLGACRLVTVTGPGGVEDPAGRSGGGPVRGRGPAGRARGGTVRPKSRRWWPRRWGHRSSRGCLRARC
jgi:hypothetical protein